MNTLNLRSAAVVLVATLSALFGTVLVQSIVVITAGFEAAGGNVGSAELILSALTTAFFGIALYVGALVTANVVSTVLAGRTREIALLRLVGATSAALRRGVVRAGLVQGVLGAALGTVLGVALVRIGVEIAFRAGALAPFDPPIVSTGLIAPAVGVVLATVVAAAIGSRAVLGVSPIHATGSAVGSPSPTRRRTGRTVIGVLVLAAGATLLVLGVVTASDASSALLLALAGGVVSSVGVLVVAPVVVPPVLRAVGSALGRGPVARLAARNAVRDPVRATRATVGLGIGVTLVTTFATGLEEFRLLLIRLEDFPRSPEVDRMLDSVTGFVVVLVGFSALLAAIGMVSTLLQSVLQRRREFGLLRSLGFTTSQVRRMVSAEAVHIVATSTVAGILLGSVFGWAGAQAAFGSVSRGLIPFAMPVPVILGIIALTAAMAIVASLVAARAATRVTPVEALARV